MPNFERIPEQKTEKQRWIEIIKESDGKEIDITPERLTTETPVILTGSFSSTVKVYQALIVDLLEKGRRVMAHNKPHGIDTEEKEGLPLAELRNAAAMWQFLESKNVEKIDMMRTQKVLSTVFYWLMNIQKSLEISF